MIEGYNTLASILFSSSLTDIRTALVAARKDSFEPNDRIVILQDIEDDYPYIDAPGEKLIEIQQLVNRVDITNQFILIKTANAGISQEIDNLVQNYSHDKTSFDFEIIPGHYKKNVQQRKNTACRLMWNHLYVGTDFNVNPCCLADHRWPLGSILIDSIADIRQSAQANQIRHWMMEGYQPRACHVCYNKESRGMVSAREPFVPTSAEPLAVNYIDARLSNICNFKCRMCSEYFSSAIEQETIEIYGKDATLGYEPVTLVMSDRRNKKLHSYEKLVDCLSNQVEKIYFAGGEPLLSDVHYEILHRLIELGHENIQLQYNSNLSVLRYKHHDVLHLWNQFGNVEIGASIDAAGSVAEYMRHGTQWCNLVENINKIRSRTPHVQLTIASTVSFPVVQSLIELQQMWIQDNFFPRENFKISILTSPDFISVAALPLHHKQQLTELIQDHAKFLGDCRLSASWLEVSRYMNNSDLTHSLSDFRARFRALDRHRKESFEEVLPQFRDIYAV